MLISLLYIYLKKKKKKSEKKKKRMMEMNKNKLTHYFLMKELANKSIFSKYIEFYLSYYPLFFV